VSSLEGLAFSLQKARLFKRFVYAMAGMLTLLLLCMLLVFVIRSRFFYYLAFAFYVLIIPILQIFICFFVYFGIRVLHLIKESNHLYPQDKDGKKKQLLLRNMSLVVIFSLLGFEVVVGIVTFYSVVFANVNSNINIHPILDRALFDFSKIVTTFFIFLPLSSWKLAREDLEEKRKKHIDSRRSTSVELGGQLQNKN